MDSLSVADSTKTMPEDIVTNEVERKIYQFLYERHLYLAPGKWAWMNYYKFFREDHGNPLEDDLEGHVNIQVSCVNRRRFPYISKLTSVRDDLRPVFASLYLNASPKYLRPLQGDCVPWIIGARQCIGGHIGVAQDLPHFAGWREADMFLNDDQKEAIIDAYKKLHDRGILHGNVEYRHMLICDDGKATITDFALSRVLNPDEEARQAGLESCSHLSIRNEMRKVKFLLDWKGVREKEFRLANLRSAREAKDRAVADALMKSKTDPFEIFEEPKEPMSEEEKEHPDGALPLCDLNLWSYGDSWTAHYYEVFRSARKVYIRKTEVPRPPISDQMANESTDPVAKRSNPMAPHSPLAATFLMKEALRIEKTLKEQEEDDNAYAALRMIADREVDRTEQSEMRRHTIELMEEDFAEELALYKEAGAMKWCFWGMDQKEQEAHAKTSDEQRKGEEDQEAHAKTSDEPKKREEDQEAHAKTSDGQEMEEENQEKAPVEHTTTNLATTKTVELSHDKSDSDGNTKRRLGKDPKVLEEQEVQAIVDLNHAKLVESKPSEVEDGNEPDKKKATPASSEIRTRDHLSPSIARKLETEDITESSSATWAETDPMNIPWFEGVNTGHTFFPELDCYRRQLALEAFNSCTTATRCVRSLENQLNQANHTAATGCVRSLENQLNQANLNLENCRFRLLLIMVMLPSVDRRFLWAVMGRPGEQPLLAAIRRAMSRDLDPSKGQPAHAQVHSAWQGQANTSTQEKLQNPPGMGQHKAMPPLPFQLNAQRNTSHNASNSSPSSFSSRRPSISPFPQKAPGQGTPLQAAPYALRGSTPLPLYASQGLAQTPLYTFLGSIQVLLYASQGSAQVPPYGFQGSIHASPYASQESAQVLVNALQGLAQFLPCASQESAQVPPHASQGSAQVPPHASQGSAQVPPHASQGSAQVPPHASQGSKGGPMCNMEGTSRGTMDGVWTGGRQEFSTGTRNGASTGINEGPSTGHSSAMTLPQSEVERPGAGIGNQ